MTGRSLEALFVSLNSAGVRYLVVGGLAVVAYGYVRFTADVDLVIDLEEANLRRAVAALEALEYRPRAPVPIDQLLDVAVRETWIREKGLVVFSLYSPAHPATEVDLFMEMPFEFAPAYERAVRIEVAPGVATPFVSRADLLAMKRAAGRPQDMIDVEHLSRVEREDD